jgi:hypothetical protein
MSTHDDELLDRLADRLADRLNPAPPPNPMIESLTAATTNTAVDGEHLTATVSQAVGHHADPEETARPDLRDPPRPSPLRRLRWHPDRPHQRPPGLGGTQRLHRLPAGRRGPVSRPDDGDRPAVRRPESRPLHQLNPQIGSRPAEWGQPADRGTVAAGVMMLWPPTSK